MNTNKKIHLAVRYFREGKLYNHSQAQDALYYIYKIERIEEEKFKILNRSNSFFASLRNFFFEEPTNQSEEEICKEYDRKIEEIQQKLDHLTTFID